MASNVSVSINLAPLMREPGVKDAVHMKAEEVAVMAQSFQDNHELAAHSIEVKDTTTSALGIKQNDRFGDGDRPASAVVFTGKAWHDKRGDQWVAGTPDSGKKTIRHFGKGDDE